MLICGLTLTDNLPTGDILIVNKLLDHYYYQHAQEKASGQSGIYTDMLYHRWETGLWQRSCYQS